MRQLTARQDHARIGLLTPCYTHDASNRVLRLRAAFVHASAGIVALAATRDCVHCSGEQWTTDVVACEVIARLTESNRLAARSAP
jgi:hypothetical protein